jgi:hypothetical protein
MVPKGYRGPTDSRKHPAGVAVAFAARLVLVACKYGPAAWGAIRAAWTYGVETWGALRAAFA